jgi:hypothetical protein
MAFLHETEPDVVLFETTREAWLNRLIEFWRPYFQRIGEAARKSRTNHNGVRYWLMVFCRSNPVIMAHIMLPVCRPRWV